MVIVIHKTQSFRERFNKVWSNCKVESHGSEHMQISQNLLLNVKENSSNLSYSMIRKWVAFCSIIEPKVLMFTFNSFLPGHIDSVVYFNKLTIWNQKLKLHFIRHKINFLLIDDNVAKINIYKNLLIYPVDNAFHPLINRGLYFTVIFKWFLFPFVFTIFFFSSGCGWNCKFHSICICSSHSCNSARCFECVSKVGSFTCSYCFLLFVCHSTQSLNMSWLACLLPF